jgi:hypothetical protein
LLPVVFRFCVGPIAFEDLSEAWQGIVGYMILASGLTGMSYLLACRFPLIRTNDRPLVAAFISAGITIVLLIAIALYYGEPTAGAINDGFQTVTLMFLTTLAAVIAVELGTFLWPFLWGGYKHSPAPKDE